MGRGDRRRTWRRHAGVTAAGALLLASACASPEGPSVVLVIIDTLRADYVGAYGSVEVRTPHLDALARDGVRFERCYAQYPLTLPSVVTLFSAQWPFVHRVRTNLDQKLAPEALTLAEVFKEAGYATAGFVSALPLRAETGCGQGFDVYDDDFTDPYPIHDPQYQGQAETLRGNERRGDRTVERALAWVEKARGPYFLVVHLFDPHAPYDPPPPYAEAYPSFAYAGEVAFTDELVGRLVEGVAAKDPRGNTLVAVVADHGEGLGEHAEYQHGFFVYDATVRVPWILWWPDRVIPGVVGNDARLLDVAPTLLEAAGIAVPDAWAGESVWAVAADSSGGERVVPERPVYVETYYTRLEYGWSELRAWLTPSAKWIRAPRPELYDRVADPGEETNRADALPDRRAVLDAELSAFVETETVRARSRGVFDLVRSLELTEAEREGLRNLGYIGGGGTDEPASDLPDPKDAVPRWNRLQDSKAHVRRGRVHLEAGRVADARAAFERAVAAAPTPLARRFLAMTLARQGHYEAARDTVALAVAEAPNDAATLAVYAVTLSALGSYDEAEGALARAVMVDSTYVPAWQQRLYLLRQLGRLEAAAEAGERALGLRPDHEPTLAELARVYSELGRHQAAVDLHRRRQDARAWDPVVWWDLGRAEARAGDADAARRSLERAREVAGRGALRDSIDAYLLTLPDR